MAEQGALVVAGVKFTWAVTDGDHPVITVHHPIYGSRCEPDHSNTEIVARLLAKELLAEHASKPRM